MACWCVITCALAISNVAADPASTPPPAARCAPPTAARDAQIRARIHRAFAHEALEITPVCAEQGGWLVTLTTPAPMTEVVYEVEQLDDGRARGLLKMPPRRFRRAIGAAGPAFSLAGAAIAASSRLSTP